MSYFICPYCQTASVNWPGLNWHIRSGHREMEIPSKEEVEVVDELPEGYRVVGKRKERAVKAEAQVPTEEPIEEEIAIPKELPEDFMERTRLSLNVHNFPERLKVQILSVLALHPETHDNPNNFSNLLAHICSTYTGGATHARKIPLVVSEVFGQPAAEVPYAGAYGTPTPGFYGGIQTGYGVAPYGAPLRQEDPVSQWIRYQMWKESKEEEKVKETKIPSTLESRLSELERGYQKAIDAFNAVSEQLEKQKETSEREKLENQIAELRKEIIEARKGGGESDWLKAFLDEREKREDEAKKRLEDIIKAQSDKLAEATRELAEAREREKQAAAEAVAAEEERRRKYAKELEEHGWAPRKKETEEEILGIAKEQVLPGVVSEVRETGKALRRALGGAQGSVPPTEETPTPTTPEQAGKMAEIMEHRERIRKLQEGA